MPAKSPKPASFVKLSPQVPLNEQNKPRLRPKRKVIETTVESKTKDHTLEWNQESSLNRLPIAYATTNRFDLVVNDVSYSINSIPFLLNENTCFRVHVNGKETYLFTWDESVGKFRAIDDEALMLPDGVAEAICNKIWN